MPRTHRYIVGIDLGTTNSALACVERRARGGGQAHAVPVAQRVSETQVADGRTLPSFLYVPGEHELPDSALTLPWSERVGAVVGEFARVQGARIPSRLVSSAKSWLCHGRVDRTAAILPWDAPSGVPRLSPLEASARYLAHLRDAWDDSHGKNERLRDQEVVLTVPASFNEVARELTVQAAGLAGLEHVTLLEEPQAAFYAWLQRNSADWMKSLRPGTSILVCDIGGGTTDFTLIRVEGGEGGAPPVLRRVAVGEHLMLGGDNMDLALAHVVEQALGERFDARSWGVLLHACRVAKERLLGPEAPDSWTVTLPGRGSRLLGGMTSAPLLREDVEQIILEGFFPETAYHESPVQGRRSGIAEWGLPYASDPGVSRHLSQFLRLQGNIADPAFIPDAVLFNGAALEPVLLRQRILDVMQSWAGRPVRELPAVDLDLAVAQGAAWYGWLRETGGQRIQGGTARSYYVAVAADVAGLEAEASEGAQAVCLIPRGLEEGTTLEITEPEFRVLVERPVSFPLFASSVRHGDQPGDVVSLVSGQFSALPPLVTVLGTRRRKGARGAVPTPSAAQQVVATVDAAADEPEAGAEQAADAPSEPEAGADQAVAAPSEDEAGADQVVAAPSEDEADADLAVVAMPAAPPATGEEDAVDAEIEPLPQEIPVHLRARVTEIGTLDLWCVGSDSGEKWRLQFQVRGGTEGGEVGAGPSFTRAPNEEPHRVRAASEMVVRTFRTRPSRLDAVEPKPRGLMWAAEEMIRKRRDDWSVGLLREIWEAFDRVKQRRRSGEQYEAPWLNAMGFCLRPGFGYPLDDWRVNRTWEVFSQGLQYPRYPFSRTEWWVLWRRLAGGLDRERQQEIFAELAPHLLPGRKHLKTRLGAPATSAESSEVLRLAASLERLDPAQKEALGELALRRLEKRGGSLEYWMLARLGARVLLGASPHHCVDVDVAERWLGRLVELPWRDARAAGFAACQVGRLADDRVRELPEPVRRAAFARLVQEGLTELAQPLVQLVEMKADEEAAVAGESLPVGLRLATAR